MVHLRDEPAKVLTQNLWPGLGETGASREVRAHGLHIDAVADGRLIAWVRRTTGMWLAVVEVEGRSADGRASVPMTLWCPRNAVRAART